MRVVVGLGSNVGDRIAYLREAVRRIPHVVARSRVYETAPVGGPAQGDFLNAAVLVEYTGSPTALLDELQAIEGVLGRTRDVRWGPRTIDLDLLWGVEVKTSRLVVPHPRLHERAFAIAPLLDVVPDAPYVAPPDDSVRVTALTL